MIEISAALFNNVYAEARGAAVLYIKCKNSATIYYQNGDPIVVIKHRGKSGRLRLASDKASVLQLRRMKAILATNFETSKQMHMDELKSEVIQIISDALNSHMDDILTGKER